MPDVTDDLEAAPQQSRIFELPIELGHPDELLERIIGWVGAGTPTKRVMYVNAHVLNQSREDPALRTALEEADLVYCDGYGVRLAAKALSTEIPHRMTGADWIWDLATLCEARGASVYLLGCEPGVARQAGQRLRRSHPKLRVVGTHHGYFEIGSGHDERVIEDINRCKPGHPARRHGNAQAGDLGAAHGGPRRLLACCGAWAPCSTSSRDAYRGHRPPWRTMDSNGSSDWRSSRSGCGGATWWGTRCS